MFVDTLPVGPLQANCYLVTCAETRAALLVDPGWNSPTISEAIAARRADVRLIVNTHAHWDHIGGNARFVQETGAPLALHRDDLPLLRRKGGAAAWGVPLQPSPEPDRLLNPATCSRLGGCGSKCSSRRGTRPGTSRCMRRHTGRCSVAMCSFSEGWGVLTCWAVMRRLCSGRSATCCLPCPTTWPFTPATGRRRQSARSGWKTPGLASSGCLGLVPAHRALAAAGVTRLQPACGGAPRSDHPHSAPSRGRTAAHPAAHHRRRTPRMSRGGRCCCGRSHASAQRLRKPGA